MSAPESPIPVTLLTGFLGSGKTTLLKRLLAHPELADCAVLVSEFGEIALDHQLVRAVNENVVLLGSGCICCAVQDDLVEALDDLYLKRMRGELPPFRRVLIETSGLSDPTPLMHSLAASRIIAALYRLEGVVATVDAMFGAQQLDAHYESVKQAAVADRLLLTKIDLVQPAQADALEARLRALNPAAPILRVVHGDIEPNLLLEPAPEDSAQRAALAADWLGARRYRLLQAPAPVRRAGRHDESIDSFCVVFEQPLPVAALAAALDALAARHGAGLLRVKGIVNALGEALPLVIHGVQHVLYPVQRLPAWPDEDRRTRLVFIVRDLTPETIRDALAPLGDSTQSAERSGAAT